MAASPQNNPGGYPPPQPGAGAGPNPYPYPYGPPPPGQPNPYYYNNAPPPNQYHHPPPLRSLASCLCSLILNLFLVFLIVLFIFWIVFRPRVPQFHLTALSVSRLNTSTSQISGNWTASFNAFNPNTKMHVYYNLIESSVYYKSELLAQNRLPPFDQGTKAGSKLAANMIGSGAYADEHVVSELNTDRSGNSLKIDFVISAVTHFKAPGWWSTRRGMLWVFCLHTPMGMSDAATGVMLGDPRECYVHL